MKRSALPLLLLAACATSPQSLRTEDAPEEATRELTLQQAEQRRRDFHNVLIRLDQGMDSYSKARSNRGNLRADEQTDKLEKLIREMVLDIGPQEVKAGMPPREPGENFRRLQAVAVDGSKPQDQAIALAALGFCGQQDVMPTILQGAQLDDPVLVARAVFGLAILRAPATPPGVLAAVIENEKLGELSRTQAAWALYELQDISDHKDKIVATWKRLLTEKRDTLPAGVIVQAVRGLGLSRDKEQTELVAGFLKHQIPKVREAAAVAAGRLNAQTHVADLIAMIGPTETVPNVRLAARKALQELAGQEKDYGYDESAWRKAFDRGR